MEQGFTITLAIVVVTVIVSLISFNNNKLMGDLIFDPVRVSSQRQFYRFFTSGFIHADYMHLAFNMISLYFFGGFVEDAFAAIFGLTKGKLLFVIMYVAALYVSLLPTYRKHKHNQYYLGLGASGAVSAVIFAGLLIAPANEVYLYFIPIGIPGFIFAPLYLAFSAFLERRGQDNINHSAHIWGALFGLAFILFAGYVLAQYPVLENAWIQVKWWLAQKGIISL
ncbi:MAG: rhomboid family intramembrane serine protease [Dinghuibacter sp.]|nr:rhomboid family intramembrane serine protease [Dinghuibacter sp.]